MVLDGSEMLTSFSGRFAPGNHCAGDWRVGVVVGTRTVPDWCVEETFCSIRCSVSDSHVKVLKFP